jgi:hypothetical protein
MSVVYSTILDELVAFSVWFLYCHLWHFYSEWLTDCGAGRILSVLLCSRVINSLSCGVGFTHCWRFYGNLFLFLIAILIRMVNGLLSHRHLPHISFYFYQRGTGPKYGSGVPCLPLKKRLVLDKLILWDNESCSILRRWQICDTYLNVTFFFTVKNIYF